MSTHIVHIDGDTDIGDGFRTAAEKIVAEIPEEKLRKLATRLSTLIFMLSYLTQKGQAEPRDTFILGVLKESFAHAELPTLDITLSTPEK